MLTKRIIPCLDVADEQVVKGIQFRNHRVIGDILPMAAHYSEQGADELVFYDIKASSEQRTVAPTWVQKIASTLDIPFCVAGGIRTVEQATAVLNAGADKISINSPALENPELINLLSQRFGAQCIVIGMDSLWVDDDYYVFQYTGDERTTQNARRKTRDWIREVQDRGAGEIVLNCMGQDGVRTGYDVEQIQDLIAGTHIPLIASGGAGSCQDFVQLFFQTKASGALAASVFHDNLCAVADVKRALAEKGIEVRL